MTNPPCSHSLIVQSKAGPLDIACMVSTDRDGNHSGGHWHKTDDGHTIRWADHFSAEIPAEPIA